MAVKEVLASCNPNRHGRVSLVKWTEQVAGWPENPDAPEPEVVYEVRTPGGGDPFQFDREADARSFYDLEVERLGNTPNWEAQAEYDEQWGTTNGYSEHDLRLMEGY